MDALHSEERELESELALVVYPVLTLPAEITSQIFVESLPAHGRVRPSPRKAPLVLAQICHQWREIALSTSDLWRSIDLTFRSSSVRRLPDGKEYEDAPNEGALPLLETWLSRTKERPISLTLRSKYDQPSPQLLELIPSFAAQFHRMELQLSPQNYQHLLAMPAAFSQLRDLAIHCYPHSDENLASIFGRAPALRTFRILTNPRPFSPFGPYPVLTSLELRQTAMPTLLDALIQFPLLLHLKAHLHAPINTGRPAIHIAPHLQSLIINTSVGYPAPVDPVLNWLTLPNLRRLELHHNPQFDVLSAFLTRSSCILEHLALTIVSREEIEQLRQIWPQCSSITSLEMSVEEYILEFLVTLTLHVHKNSKFHQPVLLPRLRALTVSTWKLHFEYDTLFWYLRDSMDLERHPVQLETFHLKLKHDPSGDDRIFWLPGELYLAELGRIVAEGLVIKITSPDEHSNWPDELNDIDEQETFP
ncbi:hypothetical protein FB451DRAFT_1390902 [Mycena latifolia]|nr:hypothetical protein FB451DRAFT_1390902 [Mycena latifolia]